jgi:hypothetical protein
VNKSFEPATIRHQHPKHGHLRGLRLLCAGIFPLTGVSTSRSENNYGVDYARVYPFESSLDQCVHPNGSLYLVDYAPGDNLPEWASNGEGSYLLRIDSKSGEVGQATQLPKVGLLEAVDDEGNAVLVSGSGEKENRGDLPVVNAFQPTNHILDAYVWKVDPQGNTVFATYIGGGPDVIVTPKEIDFGEIETTNTGNFKRASIKIENRSDKPIELTSARGLNPNRFDGKQVDSPQVIAPGAELEWQAIMKTISFESPQKVRCESLHLHIPGYRGQLISFSQGLGDFFVVEGSASIVNPPANPDPPVLKGISYSAGAGDGIGLVGAFDGAIYLIGSSSADRDFPGGKPGRGRMAFGMTLSTAGGMVHNEFFRDRGLGGLAISESGLAAGTISAPDDFVPTENALFSSPGASRQAFSVTNLANGSTTFSTYLPGWESVKAAFGDEGRLYLTGVTNQGNVPTKNAHQVAPNGQSDVFLLVLGPSGELEYGTYLGGSASEGVSAIAPLQNGKVALAGITSGNTSTSGRK